MIRAINIILLCSCLVAWGAMRGDAEERNCFSENCVWKTSSHHPWRRPPSLPDPNGDSQTLRSAAAKIGLYIGTMVDPTGDGFDTDPEWFRTILVKEFDMIEPGNQLKWWFIQPEEKSYNFAPADHILDFAEAHGLKVRGHNLVWGASNPSWLFKGEKDPATNFTGAELETLLVDHIRQVMGHFKAKYPGLITSWDVTNEVMGWDNWFNSDGIVWTKIGSNPDRADYVRIAFRTARAVDPKAILCMNDWDNDGSLPYKNRNGVDRTANMIATVRALKAEGVPIDCVGMEAHNTTASYEQIKAVMRAYDEMGVQVQVTEWDQRIPIADPNADADAAAVVERYLQACVDSPNCTVFSLWGFAQKYPALHYDESQGDTTLPTIFPWNAAGEKTAVYFAMLKVLKGKIKAGNQGPM